MIDKLNIYNVRNIVSAELTFQSKYTIFYGANGSGKTSILESIYLLGSARSFRTRETAPLIHYSHPELTVFGRLDNGESISIQKTHSGTTQVKLNQQSCYRSSELAYFLPCQLIYQDIFQIIDSGPSVRRAVLDWGMFHVKHSYLALWKDYRRVLKQRNALLRQRACLSDCKPWDTMLVDLSMALDEMRSAYFQEWRVIFQEYLAQLTNTACSISYYRGWGRKDSNKSLAAILLEQFDSDCQRQFTHSGAHQADIIFNSAAIKAKQNLSRGQQKIILIALKLAQSAMLSKPCVYLFDDIAAELDAFHIERFLRCISTINGQFFLTALDRESLMLGDYLSGANLYWVNDGVVVQA